MDSFHTMWLFVALLLTFIGNSFCLDCQYQAVPNSQITVSSTFSSSYGKENIIGLSDMPWVGGGISDWFSLDFRNPILLTKLEMNGGDVNVYGNGTLVKCFVTRFWLYYKNKTAGQWYKYYPKFRLEDGHDSHNETVDIKDPITSINITIKKYDECPAVNLKLTACGVCTKPNAGNISCTDDLQRCKCAPGYVVKTNTDAVKICQLDGSWSGPDLTCDDIDECTKNTTICGDNADCINVAGSYNCNCRTGFTGSRSCKDINECEQSKCHKYANCTNTVGSYECKCRKGFSGNGFNCEDINECEQTQCHKYANCTNTVGSYECKCREGFSGNGFNCEDINECEQTQCHKYANCTNTVGSYECKCREGFSGNGFNCADINECEQTQCHKYANCTNTMGSYECKCWKGFSGNGDNCTDINECEPSQCHRYANCTNTWGSYECKCLKGFSGNGVNCAGDKVNATIIRYTSTTLRYGQKLELHCEAVGLPKPGIEWQTPDDSVLSKSILIIERVKMRDNGTYKCIGNNNDTTDTREIKVTVIGTPTVTAIVHTEADVNSIRVSWRKPDDEGASKIIEYVVYYKTSSKDDNQFKTSELSVLIEGLRADTEYFIWVVARNGQGHSPGPQSGLKVFTLAPKPDTLPQPKKTKTSTSSSVNIRVMKLRSEHKTKLQVIVQKVSARKKRNTAGFPNKISNYDKAGCGGTSGCYYITAQLENEDVDFTIGDDKMYGDFKNAKLEPATTYNIYVRGLSYNGMEEENVGDPSPPLKISTAAVPANRESGSVIGIAVGLTVLFVVLIVLVLGAIIYIRSRRPKTIEIDPETGEEKGRNSELHLLTKKQHGKRKSGQVEDGQPDPNHPPVSTSGFAKFVGKLHKSDDRGFMIQYNTLETSQTYTSDFATSPENKDKNRYANIVAYDVSRVHLKQIDDDDNSSYINASFVDGYNSANAYIATQGPLPETFNDFWRMVWEKNCSSIVMLTNLQERHKLKCHKYWPEESETYGQITVTATRKEQYADYVIRTFLLMMNETEEEREIKQFHFTVWPDHGVPEYPTAILAFQRRVRAYSARDSGPLAVHCSAGVGRSGTFIVIDCMLARIQSEQSIDIYNYVRYLRTRRMYMVQTEEQYVFCHDALLESILCGNTQMAAHNLRIEMNKLRQRDATTKLTGFESEFKTLNKVSPSLPKESFVVATYSENASKNRYHDILASDHGRVTLNEDDDKEEGPYINAVYLDGYKQQNAFIVTQTPLKETIKDFWRMLYEKHSACVILLTNLALEEGDFPRFWPEEGSEEYSTFNVEVVSDVSKGDTGSEDQFQQEQLTGDIVERKFKLTKVEDKSLVVKMFQHLSWTEASVPTDISAIISLIQRIEKWQQRSGNGPITIACNNGQGRSGTFAALCSVLERVKTEQVVDVFQTIKALRIQRPGLVKDVDQYQFIHLGVQEYLDSFADYANFK